MTPPKATWDIESRTIIAARGRQLWAQSAVHGGTPFHFSVPRTAASGGPA